MDSGNFLIILVAIAIALCINFLLIRGAIRSALKEYAVNLTTYKLLELKLKGITSKDIETARRYLKLLDIIDGYPKEVREKKRKDLEEEWNSVKIGEVLTEN